MNIVLCGFMGCGKTTCGKLLAKMLGSRFIDADEYMEEQLGLKIAEIFEKSGENYFRELEHNICRELSKLNHVVIASGGGALTFERNVKLFKGKSKIIFLDVPLEKLKERLCTDSTRPLLKSADISVLYESRNPLYRAAADQTVDASGEPFTIAMHIANSIKSEKN